MKIEKPENPYFKYLENGNISILWSVFEGDWEDLTPAQIAEVLGCDPKQVSSYIWKIKKETGYEIPHISKRGRKRDE